MIDRREILDTAARVSLRPDVVEKDYVLGWVLAAISAHGELTESWLFKGGTCLKKCFFETYRFSEDLDFTVRDAAHLDEGFLKRVFADIGAWVYEETGIEMPGDRQDFEIFQTPRGTVGCQGRLSYAGPISPRTGGWPRIKLDLTASERVVLPPVRVPIFHPYTDAPEDGLEVLAYDYIEAFAEKFRALAERTRPRDLYDVVNLYRNADARPDPAQFIEVLREKCEFKGIELPRLDHLQPHRAGLEAGWNQMLSHQLPALLPVESFWDELPAIFDWLYGVLPVVAPLPSLPLSAGETVIRERAIHFPAGFTGQSFIETIRFAAANRLRIDLHYRDTKGAVTLRTVEPYSLRRSQAGDVRLMATQESDGQPRSFLINGILGVTVTQRVFVPRYPMELTATGPISIPQSFSAPPAPSFRRAVRSGPSYIFRCTICGKEFSHKTHDGTLRPHKNKAGRDCYGRYGTYVRMKY
jgi:predicted nucleotidyltransferase component of viral defense system